MLIYHIISDSHSNYVITAQIFAHPLQQIKKIGNVQVFGHEEFMRGSDKREVGAFSLQAGTEVLAIPIHIVQTVILEKEHARKYLE